MTDHADIVIVGSGMGGATLAYALAASGKRIVVLERGDWLEDSPEARSETAIFREGFYRPDEQWETPAGDAFSPGNYYNVGGNSKFYGGALIRYREADFASIRHLDGSTPGWPITYSELEPWYQAAEEVFQVRGDATQDPTEPWHSGEYVHGPVPDEPSIADLRARLKAVGLNPASIPLGLDLEAWLARAATPWDAFPNTVQGKSDAETTLSLALQHPNVTLMRNSRVERVLVDDKGYCIGVELERSKRVEATQVILAAGAVNTAALLLRSATEAFPHGLGNASDQVGRNFMNHNCSGLLALHPLRRNGAVYQKTLLVNDFYHRGAPDGAPLGNIQMLGKVSGEILSATSGLPRVVADWVAARSFDFYVMSEDLPNPDSRVSLRGDRIVLDWKRSNWRAHELLVARLKGLLKKAGFPLVLSKPFDRRTPSHQCGTARMGADPAASVVDSYGRSHDVPNLWIVDASVLPTSAAVNPALTIAALALRAGAKLREEMA